MKKTASDLSWQGKRATCSLGFFHTFPSDKEQLLPQQRFNASCRSLSYREWRNILSQLPLATFRTFLSVQTLLYVHLSCLPFACLKEIATSAGFFLTCKIKSLDLIAFGAFWMHWPKICDFCRRPLLKRINFCPSDFSITLAVFAVQRVTDRRTDGRTDGQKEQNDKPATLSLTG